MFSKIDVCSRLARSRFRYTDALPSGRQTCERRISMATYRIPVLQQLVCYNNILWGLQKCGDGYNLYTDYNHPENSTVFIMHIGLEDNTKLQFYTDEHGHHLGYQTESGYENIVFPDQEPFHACFADFMDFSKAKPVDPETIAEWDRLIALGKDGTEEIPS